MKQLKVTYTNGSIDPAIILNEAKNRNMIFPQSYIELLSKFNNFGFYVNTFEVFIPQYNENGCFNISFNHYDFALPATLGAYNAFANLSKEHVKNHELFFEIADTAEGHLICFDYTENPSGDNPKIILLIHDDCDPQEGDEYNYMMKVPIADNFDGFIEMLYDDLDMAKFMIAEGFSFEEIERKTAYDFEEMQDIKDGIFTDRNYFYKKDIDAGVSLEELSKWGKTMEELIYIQNGGKEIYLD